MSKLLRTHIEYAVLKEAEKYLLYRDQYFESLERLEELKMHSRTKEQKDELDKDIRQMKKSYYEYMHSHMERVSEWRNEVTESRNYRLPHQASNW